jgi:HPt (histidine-containing phosphotransfer) domain-containing protein/HAMP domain-containing protein
MTIRQRITMLVVISFLSISTIGGFAIYAARQSAIEVKQVTVGVVPSTLASASLIAQLKDVQLATMGMVAAKDPAQVQELQQKMAASKTVLENALKQQLEQADSVAQKGLVVQANESLVNYFSSIDDVAMFKLQDQPEMVEAIMDANVAQYLREQGSIIETLQIEKRRSADDAIQQLNQNLLNTITTLSVVTVLAVALLSVLGLLLYRQIIHPIGKMQQMMTEIAYTQDFQRRVPVKKQDEIGRSIMAFNVMLEKTQESTELVKQKTADIQAMLHNIPQGILTLMPGNIVHPEYSTHLEAILETQDIAGKNIMQLLFARTALGADTLSQVETAMTSCIGEDAMNFEFNAHLMLHEIKLQMPGGRTKIVDLNWSSIVDENDITLRMMLCVRDVTTLRALEHEANEQKRELAMIGEILAVEQEKFYGFIESSRQFIASNRKLIQGVDARFSEEVDPKVVKLLFRNMHTIKGNARTYGLLQLTNLVHETEQAYDDLRNDAQMEWNAPQLLSQLDATLLALEEYARINEDKLGRRGPGRHGGVDRFLMVEKDHVHHTLELLQMVDTGNMAALARVVRHARNNLERIGTERVQDVLAGVIGSLPSLAIELGKEAPICTIHDNGIVIKNQISDLLRNVGMHLFRNSMDHGIESVAERLAKNKPAAGHIDLTLSLDAEHLVLKLRDDGKGLAVKFIQQKAIANGLISADAQLPAEQLAQLIFEPGFSTAERVTEVSGRGVGMDAVKGFVEDEGGSITLEFVSAAGKSDFRPFETVIRLPKKFGVTVSVDTLESAPALVAGEHAAAPQVKTLLKPVALFQEVLNPSV